MENKYYPQLYGIKAVKEIQKEGEMEQEAAVSGDYSGINNWLDEAKQYVSSVKSTTDEVKSIMDIANGIGQTVYTMAKSTTDNIKRAQIDEYLANLKSLVETTETRMKQIRRAKWILFSKVSAGCVAVGTIAYLTLKK